MGEMKWAGEYTKSGTRSPAYLKSLPLRKILPIDTKLVIPSRNRAKWLMGRTNHTLKYVGHLEPTLFVRDDDPQLKAYEAYAAKYGAKLELQPSKGCFGVSQAYDMLIDGAIKEGYERLLILDDDHCFKIWNPHPETSPKIVRIGDELLTESLILWLDTLCPQVPASCLIPIARRTQPSIMAFAAPLMWAYAFYLPHFAAHPEHRYWQGKEIEARCDLNLALAMLTQGYLTAYYNGIIIPNEVNNPGGCSTYRKLEVEEASTDYLVKKFPGIVKEAISIGWGPDYPPDIRRRSVSVQWKKAFNGARFKQNFGVSARAFTAELLIRASKAYDNLMEDLRA